MKQKFSIAMSLAVILAMLLTAVALADGIVADADALVLNPPQGNSTSATQNGGTTAHYDFSAYIKDTGNANNNVFVNSGDSVTVTITRSGAWLDGGAPSSFTFTVYNTPDAGTIDITVPCGSEGTTETMTAYLSATASNGQSLSPDSFTLSYFITAGPDDASCAPSNTVPEVTVANASVTVTEGDTASNSGTYSIADGDPLNLSASIGTIVDNNNGTWSWSFGTTDGPAESQTVTITADDGQTQGTATFDLTVKNANPVITAAWATSSVACRKPATLNYGFSDAGVIDYPWTVDTNWNDGSTSFSTNAQGAQDNQTHTYNVPGTYTATVGVTDKDGGYGENTSGTLTVLQTYSIKFLQPFDGSSPSNLITNTMKSGRVVPVKVTIYDDCAQKYVTDPTAIVKIFLSLASSNSSNNDAVETYADAGASNGNTLYFRWTSDSSVPGGGFWIYNLDSRTVLGGSALVIGKTYKVDVYVGDVKATATTFALLTPVK